MVNDWAGLLGDNPKVLWGLVADVVKAVKAGEGERKTGRRPAVSCASLDELYEVLFPAAYSGEPFPQTMRRLMVEKGVTQTTLAAGMGYHQTIVSRLASGKMRVTTDLMEAVAAGLEVRPTYFAEYRAMKIGELVTETLLADPSLSADAVRRLMGVA